jgi:hypothetical protein
MMKVAVKLIAIMTFQLLRGGDSLDSCPYLGTLSQPNGTTLVFVRILRGRTQAAGVDRRCWTSIQTLPWRRSRLGTLPRSMECS